MVFLAIFYLSSVVVFYSFIFALHLKCIADGGFYGHLSTRLDKPESDSSLSGTMVLGLLPVLNLIAVLMLFLVVFKGLDLGEL
ncbi:hypothetical protein [Anaerovirgula multivorans]|uniref:hypothetical protein n=1 Tax=Anaerovirgula multivorans TaxID=312168 RepID=UPI000B780106|nr:hypothetical protein [Anaerovirgula multivorans]